MTLHRRDLLRAVPVATAALAVPPLARAADAGPSKSAAPPDFELAELSVAQLQARLADGTLTSERLTQRYLERIAQVDRAGPALRSIIELNGRALETARALDVSRKAGAPLGALAGIPVAVKDNIDTSDLPTTAGSLALAGSIPARDAFIVQRLRAAGAVLLAKTNLSEWANLRDSRSTSGWSARGGLTRNPYALDRNCSGSSSGTAAAIAASLAAVGVGTETDGSILSPSNMCGLVGLKPTVGLVSRAGIIPISSQQDTAGPMGRTVADVAALLSVLAGADPRDKATAGAKVEADYTRRLDPASLRGRRLGVLRAHAGFLPAVDKVFDEALAALKSAGATLIDDVALPRESTYMHAELEVLLYDFKAELDAYLGALPPAVTVRSLADVIAFNEANASTELAHFGQDFFVKAQAMGPRSAPAYAKALALCRRKARTEGLDRAFAKHKVDALVAPAGSPAWLTDYVLGDHFVGGSVTQAAAVAGTPSLTVPMGQVRGLPVGLALLGPAWSEGLLLSFAFAFEQTLKARRPPRFLRSVE